MVLWMMALSQAGWADEGMWTPDQLPEMAQTLQEMGLTLPAAQLADLSQAPLAAVVSIGGCTASFVSPDGLLATNHHCVEGYLQLNASAKADLARDGYTAASREAELSGGPTARAYLLERIDDVTPQIQAAVSRRMKDADRKAAIDRARSQLVAECEAEAPDRRCRVAGFYEGLSYRLIVQRELKDIRLVYAPPRSVGSYGGEIDNWMWPRHTGDFSLLRAYVAPDGSSAPHAEGNVPFEPAHHLPLDLDGASPGEFVMVAGYPGFTRRHDRASALRYAAEVQYPTRLERTAEMLEILRDHAERDPEAAARLASPLMGVGNLDKNNRELLDLLAGSNIIADKEAKEAALDAWIAEDRGRRRTYGRAVAELEATLAEQQTLDAQGSLIGSMFWVADLLSTASRAYRLSVEREKPPLERAPRYQPRDEERIKASFERMERSIYLPADRDLLAAILARYVAQPADLRVPALDGWLDAQGGVDAALERLYTAPALAETANRLALLEQDRAALEASDDPWVELAVALESWQAQQREIQDRLSGAMSRLAPQVAAASLEMRGAAGIYPDANSTLRLTFGHVEGWSPADGMLMLPQTTLAGMAAKATGEVPFDAPQGTLDRVGQPSRWVDPALGDVPVNTLSTLDITGGNSGSAVLNAAGEMVGLAFDGNVESIGADWVFGEKARTIHVDVRYLLWTLEGDPDAGWLLDELGVSAPSE